jgi:hypothetical protein
MIHAPTFESSLDCARRFFKVLFRTLMQCALRRCDDGGLIYCKLVAIVSNEAQRNVPTAKLACRRAVGSGCHVITRT